jgi:hypothetical protein
LSLSSGKLVSKFAFITFNVYRYVTFPVNIPNPDYDKRAKTMAAVTLEGSVALTRWGDVQPEFSC